MSKRPGKMFVDTGCCCIGTSDSYNCPFKVGVLLLALFFCGNGDSALTYGLHGHMILLSVLEMSPASRARRHRANYTAAHTFNSMN